MKRLLTNFAASASFAAALLIVQGCGPEKKPAKPDVKPLPEEQLDVEVQVLDDDTGKPAPKATVGTKKGTAGVKATAKTAATAPGSIDIQSVIGTTPYTIQKGESLSVIAARYGIRWQDIVALNPGLAPHRLRVGQVIQLPGQHAVPAPKAAEGKPAVTPAKTTAPATKAAPVATAGVYVVQKGDVFSKIAEKCGVKRADLRAANPQLKDVNKIRVGQKLNLPAGAKNAAAAKDSKPVGKVSYYEKKGAVATKAVTPKKDKKAVTPATVTPPVVTEKKAAEKAKAEEAAPAKAATPEVKPAEQPAKAAETTPAATETAQPAPQPYETYTVKEGEDIYAVAIRWGVSPSDLKSLNNLTSNELKPNQVLRIPKTNVE